MPPARPTATDSLPEFSEQIVGANRYHLKDKLGSGAYGKVYRALDLLYKPKPMYCAVKVLHCHPPGSKREKTQLREIVLQSKVSGHRNVVSLLDFFTNPLYLFVVLELCAGGDLFATITEKCWYQDQPARIKATFLQILDAVQHCHERHIFHRDIKPENILCSLDGATVRLADFGLSTTQRLSKEFGCGSSYYMSPECIGDGLGGTIQEYSTPHNDIWALGIIFTNLATSRNPWRYATAADGCFAAFLDNDNFLKEVLPISSGMNSILKRIFKLEWRARLSIAEIRQRVVDLETVYSTKHAAERAIVEAPPRQATAAVLPKPYDAGLRKVPPTPPRDEGGVRSPWPTHPANLSENPWVSAASLLQAFDGINLDEGHPAASAIQDAIDALDDHYSFPAFSPRRAANNVVEPSDVPSPERVRTPPKRLFDNAQGQARPRHPRTSLISKPSLAPPSNSDSTGSGQTSGPVTPQTHARDARQGGSASLLALPPDELDFRLNSSANPLWRLIPYGSLPGEHEKARPKVDNQGYLRAPKRDWY